MPRSGATAASRPRPAVSVVVPFHGDASDARAALAALAGLRIGPQDELIVVDNTPDGVVAAVVGSAPVSVVAATDQQSSYYARNVGAEHASCAWLLFIDADCLPPEGLVDDYFDRPVAEDCGILAGSVVGAAGQHSLLTRYARSRRYLDSAQQSEHHPKPIGVTANLLVRRAAWAGVGGFQEGIRSHGDSEFSWRVQEAGWLLVHTPGAVVEHRHRERVSGLFRQSARYGAGAAWLNRRRPGSCPRPRALRGLARCAAGTLVWTLTLRFERAAFKAIDAVAIGGQAVGYLLSNASPAPSGAGPPRRTGSRKPAVVLVDSFPVLSETFVAAEAHALEQLGHAVRVESVHRPERPNRAARRGLAVAYIEDDGELRRLGALTRLALRHPLRTARDVGTRGRWPSQETIPLVSLASVARRSAEFGAAHLHAHFARSSAVSAARLAAVLRVPYSVTAHGFDIFQAPRGLSRKLAGAAFVTTGCAYNLEHLRSLIDAGRVEVLHEIVMGVDAQRFHRGRPYPGGRAVLAVGRMVEKKGFRYLIEAVAALERNNPVESLELIGEGPEHRELEQLARTLGIEDRVRFAGALDPDALTERLECADLLAAPCVIAADGDRDSMPVVVKEALAMELPVVASDEVGLPEIVKDGWGRLVPPGEPQALAAALDELLSLPAQQRAEMGREGRAWVERHANVEIETSKLSGLIARSA